MEDAFLRNGPMWGLIAATAVALALFVSFNETKDEPRNGLAFGCYQAVEAPNILLDERGLQVLQPGFPRMDFRVEKAKAGIFLNPMKAVIVEKVGSRNLFGIGSRKQMKSFGFFRQGPDGRYPVFDENRLNSFTISTVDAEVLAFERVSTAKCRISKK